MMEEIIEIESNMPSKTSDLINDSDYIKKTYVDEIVGNINTILSTLTEVNE